MWNCADIHAIPDAKISAADRKQRKAFAKANKAAENIMRRERVWFGSKSALVEAYFRNMDILDAAQEISDIPQNIPHVAAVIIIDIAARHGIRVTDLISHARSSAFIDARFEAAYELRRQLPSWSLPMIGKVLGGRDHSTIMNGIRKHADRNGLPRLDGRK